MPGHKRDCEAWILRLEGRRRWGHLMASYTYADSRMNSFTGPINYAHDYNLFGREWDGWLNTRPFFQGSDDEGNGLNYQNDDPSGPYYDEYYGAYGSPVLVPILEPLSYWDPRRYEIGFRIEF
jgi:hypothetical protein